MKLVVVSDLSVGARANGSANFLHGVISEFEDRGHAVEVPGPPDPNPGTQAAPDLDVRLDDADLVLVDADLDSDLIARVGAHRAAHGGYRLYLRDSHRTRTPEQADQLDLSAYDGVLANGEAARLDYLERGWVARVWTWHEAADTRVFRPLPEIEPEADLVWIGDWESDEGGGELRDFLLRPARSARLHGHVYGAGHPASARLRIRLSGLHFCGSTPERHAPDLFARHRLTVNLPGRNRTEALRGVPTSYLFEALACGIPLISAPWEDCEGLFRAEQDYLLARDCAEMREAMQAIVEFPEFAAQLRESGLETIRSRHTCSHRVDELLAIDEELRGASTLEVGG